MKSGAVYSTNKARKAERTRTPGTIPNRTSLLLPLNKVLARHGLFTSLLSSLKRTLPGDRFPDRPHLPKERTLHQTHYRLSGQTFRETGLEMAAFSSLRITDLAGYDFKS